MWSPGASSRRLHRRIALLVDAFDATYQVNLIRYAVEACRQRRVELVVVPGGILEGKTRGAKMKNLAYNRVRPGAFDAAIVLGGTVDNEVGAAGLSTLGEALGDIPVCWLGAGPPGAVCVEVDNRAGIRALLEHLIEQHEATQIAFIRGPEANGEALQRYDAYREALAAADIAFDDRLVVSGDFLLASGVRAVEVLIEERGLLPDAIVAANDSMALGAMEALSKKALARVRGIPVCGFDNVDEASFAFPPLTTAAQPLAKMADAAVSYLMRRLDGEEGVALDRLPATAVIRKSCGCADGAGTAKLGPRSLVDSLPWVVELMRRREALAATLVRSADGSVLGLSGWAISLVESFTDVLQGAPDQAFLRSFDDLLRHVAEQDGELWRMHDIVTELRAHVLPCLASDASVTRKAEDLLQAARSLVGDAIVRVQARQRLNFERVLQLVDICGAHLEECNTVEELCRVLKSELSGLGFERGYVVVLQGADKGSGSRQGCRLLFDLESRATSSAVYPAELTVPDKYWGSGKLCNWVLLPLYHHTQELGWMLLDKQFESGHCFEVLRAHVSSALHHLLGLGALSSPVPCGTASTK